MFLFMNQFIFQGFKKQTKLHWVKIYFGTPTYNLVTKDVKANFEAKVSAIGGTLGILMGFSMLSAVEIIFFVAKASLSLARKLFGKLIEKKNRVSLFTGGNKENVNVELKCCSVQFHVLFHLTR